MTTSRFSREIPVPVDYARSIARDFGNYRLFTSGRGDACIEGGMRGDTVGAIRNATLNGVTVRQRLLAHSDAERFYRHEFCGQPPFPVENFVATLQLKPNLPSGSALLDWSAHFDAPPGESETMKRRLENSFAGWAASLEAFILESMALDASS